MIGVYCREEERPVAREFFELFKTPWEFYDGRKSYDVLITTGCDSPRADVPLQMIFHPDPVPSDVDPIEPVSTKIEQWLDSGDIRFPVYERVGTFESDDNVIMRIRGPGKAVGLEYQRNGRRTIRLGYNLFSEAAHLLSLGQPRRNAAIPTLDLHISMLRKWILRSGIPLVEIPPAPAGHDFIVCLTHDVDFIGIRRHLFDHTFYGFIFRALFGSVVRLTKGRLSPGRVLKNWLAVLTLPLVHLGIRKDFWFQFDRYMKIERDLKSTFFVLPFKGCPGSGVEKRNPGRRAASYDITDIEGQVSTLLENGVEIGLHGIDAWHDTDLARHEKDRIQSVTRNPDGMGVRMHWLCFDRDSFRILDRAGFEYDSSFGYNDAVGYRGGTAQAFRPISSDRMLELPFLMQDVAMFYPGAMNLTEARAWSLYSKILTHVAGSGGVLTTLWHMRSLSPERQWDRFYVRMLDDLKTKNAWFATANEAVDWFRRRRGITFREVNLDADQLRVKIRGGQENGSQKMLQIRVYLPTVNISYQEGRDSTYRSISWSGEKEVRIPLNPDRAVSPG